MKDTKIYKTEVIYAELKQRMENKMPFAICRMGNAEVTTINSKELTHKRSITQGIPEYALPEVLDMLRYSGNKCDFVASMGALLTEEYFEKNIPEDSEYRRWESIYKEFGIINSQYCNPDIGYLIFLEGKYNLWELIKDKRICLITSKTSVYDIMKHSNPNIGLIEVTPQTTRQQYTKDMKIPICGRWHWEECDDIKKQIKSNINNYDIFLIGAGYLAKGYSVYIRNHGGISFDVGKVMNTWAGEGLGRMVDWIEPSDTVPFSFKLTEKGKQYEGKF